RDLRRVPAHHLPDAAGLLRPLGGEDLDAHGARVEISAVGRRQSAVANAISTTAEARLPTAGHDTSVRDGASLDMRALRSLAPFLLFAAGYAAIALGVTNSYYQSMMTLVLVWACFGLSWNVLSGYTGLVSFGHAAFFGIGAYTTALGQIHFDLSPWLLIP